MKTWNRFMQISLVLFLALGLAVGTASAEEKKAEKKKKKSEKKKTEQKVEKKEEKKKAEKKAEKASGPHASLITGPNVNGRPGYFFMDTAATPEHKQLMLAAGGVFYSLGSQLSIPFGASYGIVENLQIHANTSFYSVSGVSGLSNLVFGAKYHFNIKSEHLSVAAGCDGIVGPLSNSSTSFFNIMPYGIASYTLNNGLELNGQLGIYIPGVTGATAYAQLNLGAAYPFSSDWSGMAELNLTGALGGSSPLIAGIRTNGKVQFQAFGGLDLATTVGVIVGGGLSFVTQ